MICWFEHVVGVECSLVFGDCPTSVVVYLSELELQIGGGERNMMCFEVEGQIW